MNWLRNFMMGRYGSDQLSWATLIIYLLLSLLLPRNFLRYLALIPLAIFWYRFLSRDLARRAAENRLFLEKIEPLVRLLRKKKREWQDKEHRYYSCPGCGQTLRVPRGRGKITITCPKCKQSIVKKT